MGTRTSCSFSSQVPCITPNVYSNCCSALLGREREGRRGKESLGQPQASQLQYWTSNCALAVWKAEAKYPQPCSAVLLGLHAWHSQWHEVSIMATLAKSGNQGLAQPSWTMKMPWCQRGAELPKRSALVRLALRLENLSCCLRDFLFSSKIETGFQKWLLLLLTSSRANCLQLMETNTQCQKLPEDTLSPPWKNWWSFYITHCGQPYGLASSFLLSYHISPVWIVC